MAARKTKKRAGAESPERVRKSFFFEPEVLRDFVTYAAHLRAPGVTESTVANDALKRFLKSTGFYVAVRPPAGPEKAPLAIAESTTSDSQAA